jgi:hypothetical protein
MLTVVNKEPTEEEEVKAGRRVDRNFGAFSIVKHQAYGRFTRQALFRYPSALFLDAVYTRICAEAHFHSHSKERCARRYAEELGEIKRHWIYIGKGY